MTALPFTDPHANHELVALSGRREPGIWAARLVCLDCDVVIGPLPVCGRPTLKGGPCRVTVRTDLGYRECWSHGEGRGRTNAP